MNPSRSVTLLVVEDNADHRQSLVYILRHAGYAVGTASNGSEGLDYLRNNPRPGLILLDMLLPVLDGWHFLEELRTIFPGKGPPIIVTTGSEAIGRDWAEAHGCAGFVRKPVAPEALLAEIRRCLGPA